MTHSFIRKAQSFLRQPSFIRFWFIPAWLILGFSKALIFTVSFRRLAPRLGRQTGIAPWVPLLDPRQETRAMLIGRVVKLAARYTPWDSNCFPQAVATRLLLGLYGVPYILYFGLTRDTDAPALKAHAWVAAGKVRVSGGTSFGQFTVVGCFISPLLQDVSIP